jgi:hypothetical protein
VTFDAELALRVVAALAAVALVASPLVVGAWGKARALLSRVTPPPADAALEDMRLVLEIANRLRHKGCEDGVDLCEKLLNVMLTASPKE